MPLPHRSRQPLLEPEGVTHVTVTMQPVEWLCSDGEHDDRSEWAFRVRRGQEDWRREIHSPSLAPEGTSIILAEYRVFVLNNANALGEGLNGGPSAHPPTFPQGRSDTRDSDNRAIPFGPPTAGTVGDFGSSLARGRVEF